MRNRLHALCPYFAMFPEAFVEKHLNTYTAPRDYVFDPFAGRGTAVLQSLLMGRHGVGTDINPVAYCVSAAKADVPSLQSVLREVDRLEAGFTREDRSSLADERRCLPPFFGRAFHHATLEQILFLRRVLNWRRDGVHRFVAAMVLGTMHGEMDTSSRYLSNQMPRTISPKPGYSLRYWRQRNLWPKKRRVFQRLREEAEFRLSGEIPNLRGQVRLTDARRATGRLGHLRGAIGCIITSPPYFDVTDCGEDQWLRLWFLGHAPWPTCRRISKDDRHGRKDTYWKFLREVWNGVAPLTRRDAVLICRLGGKGMTEAELTEGLTQSVRAVFPRAHMLSDPEQTSLRRSQTRTFRPGAVGCRFEVDYIFALHGRR